MARSRWSARTSPTSAAPASETVKEPQASEFNCFRYALQVRELPDAIVNMYEMCGTGLKSDFISITFSYWTRSYLDRTSSATELAAREKPDMPRGFAQFLCKTCPWVPHLSHNQSYVVEAHRVLGHPVR